MTENRKNIEQFQLRLPIGLRSRIKAYAAAHDRSLNAEIVRVLEREFPEPWDVEDKIEAMSELIGALKNGAGEEKLTKLAGVLEETIEGIVSGRITNVEQVTRARVEESLQRYREDQYENTQNDAQSIDLDPEELDIFNRTGNTQKFIKITKPRNKD